MAYREIDNNPLGKRANDSVIRAIATALREEWENIYWDLMLEGFALKDAFTADYVWGSYLYRNGFNRHIRGENCPKYYTLRQFANDHPQGVYVVSTGEYTVAVVDGYYIDNYDSGDRPVVYFWQREVI